MFLDPRLFGNSFNKCRPWRALLRIVCGHDLAMAVDNIEIPSQWWWTWCWKQTQRARQTDSTPTFVKKPSQNRCYSLVKIIIHPNYIIYIYTHTYIYSNLCKPIIIQFSHPDWWLIQAIYDKKMLLDPAIRQGASLRRHQCLHRKTCQVHPGSIGICGHSPSVYLGI